jgi:hypothetical protein
MTLRVPFDREPEAAHGSRSIRRSKMCLGCGVKASGDFEDARGVRMGADRRQDARCTRGLAGDQRAFGSGASALGLVNELGGDPERQILVPGSPRQHQRAFELIRCERRAGRFAEAARAFPKPSGAAMQRKPLGKLGGWLELARGFERFQAL